MEAENFFVIGIMATLKLHYGGWTLRRYLEKTKKVVDFVI